jgi:hypothetical protein
MPDPLEALDALEGLSARDAVIARVLIKNDMVKADDVLACARGTIENPKVGDLLDQLIAAEHLTPERAISFEEALDRQIARRAPPAAPPAPTSASKRGGKRRR